MLSAPSKWPFRSTRIYLISSLGFCHSFTSCSVCSHDCFFSKLWLFSNFSIRVRLHSICPKVVLSLLFARKQNLNVPIVQKGRLHILTSQQCINKQKANPKQHYVLLLLREEWLSPPDPPHWKVKADTSPSLHTTVLAEIFLSPYPVGVAFLPKNYIMMEWARCSICYNWLNVVTLHVKTRNQISISDIPNLKQ